MPNVLNKEEQETICVAQSSHLNWEALVTFQLPVAVLFFLFGFFKCLQGMSYQQLA